MSEPIAIEQAPIQRFNKIRAELSASGIHGLSGRLQRGLDPMAMLVVRETQNALVPVCHGAGVDINRLRQLTEELHFGGIWKHAEQLATGQDPEIQAWMFLSHTTEEVNDHDLSTDELLADVDRILGEYRKAESRPVEALAEATAAMRTAAHAAFSIEDGVAVAHGDHFIYMAMAGETAGVCTHGELLFVGADTLDIQRVATQYGLREEQRFDERRQANVTFYVGNDGVEIKVLGRGFCIVFGSDTALAKELARTGQRERLSHEHA